MVKLKASIVYKTRSKYGYQKRKVNRLRKNDFDLGNILKN